MKHRSRAHSLQQLVPKRKTLIVTGKVVLAISLISVISFMAHWYQSRRQVQNQVTFEIAKQALGESRFEDAITAYEQVVKDPNAPAIAWRDLGFAYQLARRPEDAITAYETYRAQEPEDIVTLNTLGNLYRQKGDYFQAEAFYRQVLTINPRYVTTLTNLAHVYNVQQKYSETIILLERVYDRTSQMGDIGLQLAQTYVLASQPQKAKQVVEQVLAADRTNEKAKSLLATLP